ncbi:hypothetical protein [Limnochorda pilosa]|uniref:Uncharacterized protein n=1 Tax=Limnochorda pilosa TaxID=1555112 RepID=A0A0K2SIJ9_LIMPI|nr:hypothetical protein [Limnochorda pilosa]BAS26938.1 hypothetical protein LIP_1081 [Limnochorda pilosa]
MRRRWRHPGWPCHPGRAGPPRRPFLVRRVPAGRRGGPQDHRGPGAAERPPGDAPRRRGLFARWGRWRAAAILLLLASLAANGRLVLETWKPGGSHSEDALVAQLEALQEVLFAPEYVAPRVFALEGAGSDPAGKVAFCRVSDGSFYVMVASRGWPPDAPDQGYHLWLQAGDQVIDGGRLTFTGDRGLAVLELPEPIPVQAVRLGTGQGSPMLWTQVDDPWPAPRETW